MHYKSDINEYEAAAAAAKILFDNNLKISAAESCTGGMFSALLVSIPGISSVFDGSVVTYGNDIKVKYAGVSEETLKLYGAVSKQVAQEMATGIRKNMNADIGVSATGVAGPDGGTSEKPVGLVYIGYSDSHGTKTKALRLNGDRESIRQETCKNMFLMICENVEEI